MRPKINSLTSRKRPRKREITFKPSKQEKPEQLLKREIKQEVKQEVKQEATLASLAPSTPPSTTTLPKRPRVVSSEFSTPGPAGKGAILSAPSQLHGLASKSQPWPDNSKMQAIQPIQAVGLFNT
jgi:hypothetical protein